MKILAIEFSSAQRSAALLESESGALLGSASEMGGREMKALGLVQQALEQAGVSKQAVECIAVGIGPGSYAGIRASISLAQGWQVARGVHLVGLSSVEVLAATARERGMAGPVQVIIDAQRGEFYIAGYLLSPTEVKEVEPLKL